jgi:hypothetical protein
MKCMPAPKLTASTKRSSTDRQLVTVYWNVAPRSLVEINRCFRQSVHLQGDDGALSTSETSTVRNIPEDSHLQTRSENLNHHHLRVCPLYRGFPSPKFLHLSLSLVSSSVSPWFALLRLTLSSHLSLGLPLLRIPSGSDSKMFSGRTWILNLFIYVNRRLDVETIWWTNYGKTDIWHWAISEVFENRGNNKKFWEELICLLMVAIVTLTKDCMWNHNNKTIKQSQTIAVQDWKSCLHLPIWTSTILKWSKIWD